MSKPTIVCVPGAWLTPEIYSKVFEILSSHGYPTIGLPLESVGAEPHHSDFHGDVKGIRDCLTKLVSEGKEVVLVSHSYSGMPASEAPVGLGKKEREEKGLLGGVIRLVFIMAFAMPEGFQPTAGGAQFPDWMDADLDKGVVIVSAENAKRIFFHDLSSEEGDKWVAKLQHQSLGVYGSTTTYAAWRHIPSTFVIGTQDRTAFTPEIVEMIINISKPDVVERCDGGHCLMISRPDFLAGVLRRATGENC